MTKNSDLDWKLSVHRRYQHWKNKNSQFSAHLQLHVGRAHGGFIFFCEVVLDGELYCAQNTINLHLHCSSLYFVLATTTNLCPSVRVRLALLLGGLDLGVGEAAVHQQGAEAGLVPVLLKFGGVLFFLPVLFRPFFTCEVIFSSPPSESSSSSWMVDWFGIGATSSVVHWVSLLLQRRLKNTYQVLLNKLLKFQMQSTKSLIKKKKCWRWMNTSSSSSMSYRREFQGKTSTRVTKSLLVCLQ